MARVIETYVIAALLLEWEEQAEQNAPNNAGGKIMRRTVEVLAKDIRRVLRTWSVETDT